MNNNDYEERFSSIILNPLEWKKTAECLIESAKLLEPKINDCWEEILKEPSIKVDNLIKLENYGQVYIMLSSYALENIFKAFIVQKNKDELETEIKIKRQLPHMLRSHDLYNLAKKAGLNLLAKEEESMLKRLTRGAMWYGRYPAPTKPEDLETLQKSEESGSTIHLNSYASYDCMDIKRIVDQVSSQLSATILH